MPLPLTPDDVLGLADPGSLERGRDYARRGKVQVQAADASRIDAFVAGTSPYVVHVGRKDFWCTCPVGTSGDFCKHLVATVLVAAGEDGIEPGAGPGSDVVEVVSAFLAGLEPSELTAVIAELHGSHPDALESLARAAARTSGDVAPLVGLVDSLRIRRSLDWRGSNRHGRHCLEVAADLELALSPATAPALLPLVEKGVMHLVRGLERADDSSGVIGSALGRLLDLHVEVARAAAPDVRRLATWMVRTTADERGWSFVDVVPYAEVLGERGLAAYRTELDKAAAAQPDRRFSALDEAYRRLAVLSGDPAEIVRLVGRDLSNQMLYRDLVAALLEAGHQGPATEWALRAVEAGGPRHLMTETYDQAVRLLQQRRGPGDVARVLDLRRAQLRAMADTRAYGSLRKAARASGTWETDRMDALDVLLERDPDAWVQVLLGDGEGDLAWDASRTMQLRPSTVLALVRARAKTHPADVLDAWEALIDEALVQADQQRYRVAVGYLRELSTAADRAGTPERSVEVRARLLEQHRRRPTLVDLLRRL